MIISQNYPLFVVDEDGNISAVVGWQTGVDARFLVPLCIGVEGYREIGVLLLVGTEPLRYFIDLQGARRYVDSRPGVPTPTGTSRIADS